MNPAAPNEIYTLSLHDALPICRRRTAADGTVRRDGEPAARQRQRVRRGDRPAAPLRLSSSRFPISDRKSTRLNSSHANISYAVFCLKKKIKTISPLSYDRQPTV